MKKALVLMVTVSMFLFAVGCSSNEGGAFSGESEHWKAELNINEDSPSNAKELVIHYKGDLSDLKSLKKLVYSYKFGSSGGTINQNFDGAPIDKNRFSTTIPNSNDEFEEQDNLEVIVQWLGNREFIQLN